MFIIDDILAWFWCSITTCKKKEEAPQVKEASKKQEVEIKKKEVANDSKPANSSNSTNSTSRGTEADSSAATPASKPANSTGSAQPISGSGENNDLTPSENTLETIKRLKSKQDAKSGTDKIGGKEAKNADEVTRTKKDMAAGPENEFKDQPAIAQKM